MDNLGLIFSLYKVNISVKSSKENSVQEHIISNGILENGIYIYKIQTVDKTVSGEMVYVK